MNLNRLLQERNMSQYALSKKSGVGQGAISQYASGQKTPGGKNLLKLSDALGCSIDDLLRDDAPPATETA